MKPRRWPLMQHARDLLRVFTLAALLLAGTAVQAGEADPAALAGSWDVFYVDRNFGPVSGRALVDENAAAVTVRLVDPASGERYTLRSSSFVRDGANLKVTLEGAGPQLERSETALGQELAIGTGSPYEAQGPLQVELRLGEATKEIQVREPEPVARQRIELDLAIHDNTLSGTWTQLVNPETGRDQDGGGRMGDFAYLNDGTGRARQLGYESWSRLRPKVHLVVPYTDQYVRLLSGDPRFPYFWQGSVAERAALPDRRYLLVLGEDLPIEIGESVILDSNNDGIHYELEAKPYQLEDRPTAQAMVTAAWKTVEADLRTQRLALAPDGILTAADEAAIAQTLDELRSLDFVLLRAELSAGTLPGKTSFKLNEAEGSWSLRYGDLSGDFTFARPLPGGADTAALSEPIDFAFTPDKIYLELRTTRDIPLDSVLFQLWINGKPHLIDGWRNFAAAKLPISDEDQEHLAYRKASVEAAGGNPEDVEMLYIYRSPAIALLPAGMAPEDAGDVPGVDEPYRISVNDGDLIRGVLGIPDEFQVTPSFAEIRVVSSPVEMARYTLGGEVEQNLSWSRALDQARQCAMITVEPPLDWNAIARMKAYTFTNTILLEGERTSLDMLVGDLAAMLVLRDVFIEMMTRQERNLAQLDTPAELAAFRAHAEVPVASYRDHPLGTIDVSTPNGETLSYALSYADDEFLNGRYGLTTGNLPAWREAATRQAVASYLTEVRKALALAQGTAPCGDFENLVELTGRGFDGVYRHAVGRLVSTESTALAPGDYWKPDRQARAWLLGVPTFAAALQAQRDYSAADTRAVVTGTMLATAGVSIGGGLLAGGASYLAGGAEAGAFLGSLAYSGAVLSQVGQALAFTLDIVGVATTLSAEFAGKTESLAEIEFARGAALAIGTNRLERAIEADKSMRDLALSISLELGLALVGNYDVAETVQIFQRFGRGARVGGLTDNLVRGGSRTVAQADAIQRGRALFGDAAAEAQIATRATPQVTANPPAIEASDFAESFPNAEQLQAVSSIRVDDLRNPADPNTLRSTDEIAPNPEAVFGAPGDTVAAGTPTPQAVFGAPGDTVAGAAAPPPGAFAGSATQPVAPASAGSSRQPANVADFARANREAVEALERARNEAEAVFYAGAELSGLQAIRLEAEAQNYMAQSLLTTAAREAQNAGVSLAEIEALLVARAAMQDPMAARYALIRDLEFAALEKLGYQVLSEPDAVELLDFVTRALNSAADATPLDAQQLARLKQWIDAYAQGGVDLFDQLRRMGTFNDAVEEAGVIVNPGAGFEAITDAEGIAALRKVAEDNGLLVSSAERTVSASRAAGQPVLDSLDAVRALEGSRSVDAFAAMVEARRVAQVLGEEALDQAERLAFDLSLQALSEAVGNLPQWARALDRATFDILQPLAARADIRAFAQSNPAELAAFTRDSDALTALRRQPYGSFDELAAEVAREQRRIKSAVPGFFEQTAPANWAPKDLVFNDIIYSATARERISSSTRILKDGREVGAFERELEVFTRPDGSRARQVVFSYANGKDAPRYLTDVEVPLIPGRGAPLATFLNVRAFHNLGIPFGDPSIARIKMSQVVNANTSIELAWMQRMYGAENLGDYLRHTHSVRYAESALNQAGYRIAGVQLGTGKVGRDIAGEMVNSDYFNAVEAPLDFLRRYGIEADEVIETGHDIYIDIVPL